jgi:hypothetical protein
LGEVAATPTLHHKTPANDNQRTIFPLLKKDRA